MSALLLAAVVATATSASDLARDLALFDAGGSGDRDGVVELPDFNPTALAAKFRELGSYADDRAEPAFREHEELDVMLGPWRARLRETLRLWRAYRSLCRFAELRCPGHPSRAGARTIEKLRKRLTELDATKMLIARESYAGQPVLVAGDSLTRGYQTGSEPSAFVLPPLATAILRTLGFPEDEVGQMGLDGYFPQDGLELAYTGSAGTYYRGFVQQIQTLGFPFVRERAIHRPDAPVRIQGLGGSTLHEYLRSREELEAEGWGSIATPVFRRLSLPPHASYVDLGLQWMEEKLDRTLGRARGGLMAFAFGSNDLMTFRHVIVGAPEQDPWAFKSELYALDERTKELAHQRGVRRVFLVAPDVSLLFYPVPAGARYVGGDEVPSGAWTLYHWAKAAERGRALPPKVVLERDRYRELRARYRQLRQDTHEVLGAESNWLVLDNAREFPRIVHASREGIAVDAVPYYGKLYYLGPDSFFSPDNEHPSNFGYLAWSELIVQAAIDAGVAVPDGALYRPEPDPERAWENILRRVARGVRANPGYYAPTLPSRYSRQASARVVSVGEESAPINFETVGSEGTTQLALLDRILAPFGEGGAPDPGELERALPQIWPLLRDDDYREMASVLSLASSEPAGDGDGSRRAWREQIVGALRGELAKMPAPAAQKLWAASLGAIARGWVEAADRDLVRKERFVRGYFESLGHPDDSREPADYRSGHTPSLLRPGAQLELTGAGALRRGGSGYRAGASLGFVTATGYVPLPIFDYVAFAFGAAVEGETPFNLRPFGVETGVWTSVRLYPDAVPGFELAFTGAFAPVWKVLARVEGDFAKFDVLPVLRGRASARLSWSPWADAAFGANGFEVFADPRAYFGGERLLELSLGLGWRL